MVTESHKGKGKGKQGLNVARRPYYGFGSKRAKMVTLSAEQSEILECASRGSSVFFSGSAGTGKSVLLRQLITRLRERYNGVGEVAVCAATGIAAVNIGGTTVHSWSGIGLGEGTSDFLLQTVLSSKHKCSIWTRTKVLLIDEISMLDGTLLDTLEFIARKVRCDDRIFGGLQLVLCGDFFQLPPIRLGKGNVKWCFMAECWQKLVPQAQQFMLRKVFRQSEASFVAMLDEIRHGGKLSLQTCNALQATESNTFGGGIEPTRLCSHNVDVDLLNEARLEKLSGEVMCFAAVDGGREPYLSQVQKSCIAPDVLKLKVGAQVMLLKNLDPAAGLVNGARGFVQGFEKGYGKDKQPGMPIICVYAAHGSGTVTRTMQREEWTVEFGGKVVAQRSQIPLRLAWAISIHKSQGMTIDALEADLGSIFEYGQAYVALSRATSLARLRVLNFNARRVKSHPEVVEFYRRLKELSGITASGLSVSQDRYQSLHDSKMPGNGLDSYWKQPSIQNLAASASCLSQSNALPQEQEEKIQDPDMQVGGGYWVFQQDAEERAKAEKAARQSSVMRRDDVVPEKKIVAKLEEHWKALSRLEKAPWNTKAKTKAKPAAAPAQEPTTELAAGRSVGSQRVEVEVVQKERKEFAQVQQVAENDVATDDVPGKQSTHKSERGNAAEPEAPAKRRKLAKAGEAQFPVIDASVLQKAKALGFEGQLRNLLSRPEIVGKDFSHEKMLSVLEESGGLVNKAKYALLGGG